VWIITRLIIHCLSGGEREFKSYTFLACNFQGITYLNCTTSSSSFWIHETQSWLCSGMALNYYKWKM